MNLSFKNEFVLPILRREKTTILRNMTVLGKQRNPCPLKKGDKINLRINGGTKKYYNFAHATCQSVYLVTIDFSANTVYQDGVYLNIDTFAQFEGFTDFESLKAYFKLHYKLKEFGIVVIDRIVLSNVIFCIDRFSLERIKANTKIRKYEVVNRKKGIIALDKDENNYENNLINAFYY